MPLPLLPLIAAGAALTGQGIGAISQSAQNKKSREWQEKMFDRERANSLADFAMQNEYNHPSSQMARLREAGLNPNLVYGNGTQQQAAQIKAADAGQWNPQPIRFNPGDAMAAYTDTQMRAAQVDNLRVQNTVMDAEKALKMAQVAQTVATTDKSQFELGVSKELRQTTIDAALANVQKTMADIGKVSADTQYTLDENERKAALQAPTLEKALEEVLNVRLQRELMSGQINLNAEQIKEIQARIKQISKQTEISDVELQRMKRGIFPNDPWFIKTTKDLWEEVKKGFKMPGSKMRVPLPVPGQPWNFK